MIDIAPPMSIIDPHLPAQESSSVRVHADSDTFCPLSETPAAALTTSMDVFSVRIFLSRLTHAFWLLSKLFVCPSRLLMSVRFFDVIVLRPYVLMVPHSSLSLWNYCPRLEHGLKWRGNRNEKLKLIQQSTMEGGQTLGR